MKKVTTSHHSQDDRYIFTEDINYHDTGDTSIWGTEDDATVQALSAKSIRGRWLNVCAGDGRFNARLLSKVDEVVAFDIDESALSKLQHTTPKELRGKLSLQVGNIVERFPFVDGSFAGVFCTGTLHLFPDPILRRIASEIDRVLRPGGMILLDYATDIRREFPDGSLYVVPGEPNHTLEEGIRLLKDCFPQYENEVVTSIVPPEEVVTPKYRYMFQSNFFLLIGAKSGGS